MLYNLVFIFYLVLLVFAAPALEERQSLANVITSCTVPNTVAITFVGTLLLLVITGALTKCWLRMTVPTIICQPTILSIHGTMNWHLTSRDDLNSILLANNAVATFFFSTFSLLTKLSYWCRNLIRRQQLWVFKQSFTSGSLKYSDLGRCIYSPDSINRVKFIYGQGHMVASHTWSHKDLTQLTWDQRKYPFLYSSQHLTLY